MPTVVHRNWQAQFLAPPPIYLDASVTVAWLTTTDQFHAQAVQFTGDHLLAQRELQVSLLTLDETIYRLLRGLIARSRRVPPRAISPGLILKQQPGLLSKLRPRIQIALGLFLNLVTIVDGRPATPRQILDSWLDRFDDVGGLRDAGHLSVAQHAGAKALVTADTDFQAVVTLPVSMEIIKI